MKKIIMGLIVLSVWLFSKELRDSFGDSLYQAKLEEQNLEVLEVSLIREAIIY